MTQEILNTLPSLAPFRVVVETSTVVAQHRGEDGQPKPVETMFVCMRGLIAEWTIRALPTNSIYEKWDSVYDTMVDAVLNVGTTITDPAIIQSISNCDEEMLQTYKI